MAAAEPLSLPRLHYLHIYPHGSPTKIRAWGNKSLACVEVPRPQTPPTGPPLPSHEAGIKIQYDNGEDVEARPGPVINPSRHISWGPGFVTSQRGNLSVQNKSFQIWLWDRKTGKMWPVRVYSTCCLPLLLWNAAANWKGREKKCFSGTSCQDLLDNVVKRWSLLSRLSLWGLRV